MQRKIFAEWTILGPLGWLLLGLALALMGLTHGVLELASRWQHHFVENCEAFFPLALALATAPLILLEAEQGMIELTFKLPTRRILNLRWFSIWGPFILLAGVVLTLMSLAFGPVDWVHGLWAGIGPAALLSAIAVAGASYSGRLAVGYVAAIALLVTDLILRVLGAFSALPILQWIDCFAYRWPTPDPTWQVVSSVQLIIGLFAIEAMILDARRCYRRLL